MFLKRGYLSSVIQKSLTTSLVVTCDSVNFLLENHMKCFNKVIFSKLIFSFKVLMYCGRENVACFLCLLIISKCSLDSFYDGSKSITDCNSCNGLTLLERKISTSTSALDTEIIFNLLSLTAEIKELHFHLHTLIRMLDWTFCARGLSLEFGSD